MAAFAVAASSVTMCCWLPARATSSAVTYFSGTVRSSATAPAMPLRHSVCAFSTARTARPKPSYDCCMWRRIWSLSAVRFASRIAVSCAVRAAESACRAACIVCAFFCAAALPASRSFVFSAKSVASFSFSLASASSFSCAAASARSRSAWPAPPSSMSFSSTAMACCCSVNDDWSFAISASVSATALCASEACALRATSFLRSASICSSADATAFLPSATASVRRPMSPAARTSSCVSAALRASRRSRTTALFSVRSRSVASSAVTASTCFWSSACFSPSRCIDCSMATMPACTRSFSASAAACAASAAVFSSSALFCSASAAARLPVSASWRWWRLVRWYVLYSRSSAWYVRVCSAFAASGPSCPSISCWMSLTRTRFFSVSSSFFSVSRLRALYFVIPAVSSKNARRSSGRLFKMSSMRFCPMTLMPSWPMPVSANSW